MEINSINSLYQKYMIAKSEESEKKRSDEVNIYFTMTDGTVIERMLEKK